VFEGRVIERSYRDLQTSRRAMFALRINLGPLGARYFEEPLYRLSN
jgi:hypothetical protein